MTEPPRVCLCVPTFRRPEGLRKLLADVERLNYAGPIDIIVVDNDAESRAGAAVVEAVARTFRFPLTCIVEPRRGQTYAYNRAFAHACRATPAPDYVAVLDDDEYPDANWLTEMIRVARAYGVDIVGGPVFPVFDNPGHWLAKSGLYAPSRNATGPLAMIYGAGNMLIRRSVLEDYLDEPFAHAYAYTGGSDYDFFWRCRNDGRSFAWADDAQATRLERKFLGTAAGALRGWCIGLGLIGLGIASLPLAALRGRRAVMASLIRAARGAGRIAAEFDLHYEQYR
jgi:glycosyltransferase involved in cell wall biosynthesis